MSNSAMKSQNKPVGKNIQVAVRMRPLLLQIEDQEVWQINHESNKIISVNNQSILSENININNSFQVQRQKKNSTNKNAVERNNRYQFVYDHAFGPMHTNQHIYQSCCENIIDEFSERGRNGTIFMYGQTTSGKTFTMLGDQETKGLISYSLQDICNRHINSDGITLNITYLEIYNEQINDLLNPGSTNLKIIDDKVHGAKEWEIKTFQQAQQLLTMGEQQRSYSEKNYHDHSSRSHTIFQIKKTQGKSKAVLNLVDLAGSERMSDQQNNQETGYINKSLFVLSNVIHRLASSKKNTHIPYRDSKLTRFLMPSLSGQSLTAVICTISPASVNFYQSLSTLRFAACSRKVQLKPLSNSPQMSRQQSFLSQQSKTIAKLKEQNEKLRKDYSSLSFMKDPEQNYLESKLREIGEQLKRSSINLPTGWQAKLEMLCLEYKRNVEALQKQYTKAMVNALTFDCGVERQKLDWVLKEG